MSRIAQACPYGPKVRTPFFFWPRGGVRVQGDDIRRSGRYRGPGGPD
ncbi:hypothetical protein SVIOM342S_01946 [Streptomyces violaceorubidus]